MLSVQETASELIYEIIAAFDGVSREGGVSLHETRVYDDYGYDIDTTVERAEARAKDTDTKWQDVPYSSIEKPDLHLSFLDPIGFRYYIPAYMIWQLRQLSGEKGWADCNTRTGYNTNPDSNTYDAALYSLTPYESEERRDEMRAWQMARFEILTDAQSRAVYKFLCFYVEYGEDYDKEMAQKAIDGYWHTFS